MRSPRTGARRQHGFTLVEMAVAFFVTVALMVAVFQIIDRMSALSNVQLNVADMQQSVRIAQRDMNRLVRMAGRGGLLGVPFAGQVFTAPAIAVRNNVNDGVGRAVAPTNGASPLAVPGTDILTVRGVLTSTIFMVDYANAAVTYTYDGINGTVSLTNLTSGTIPQNLLPLVEVIDAGVDEAVVVVSALDSSTYGVAELDTGNSFYDDDANPTAVTLAFRTSGGTHAADFAALSSTGAFPTINGGVVFAGILEEYRFFVREVFDDDNILVPRLSRAHVFPGTDTPHPNGGLALDIADNIFDLQVALGYDSSFGGFFDQDVDNVGNDDIVLDNNDGADDWLFNAAADADALDSAPWDGGVGGGNWDDLVNPRPTLLYARISTLGLTERRDREYDARRPEFEPFTSIEDHSFDINDNDDLIYGTEPRTHRRLLLQTVIDLRNQS